MKKLLCGLLGLALLTACGSDTDIAQPSGAFASEGDMVFTVYLDGAECTRLTVENKEGVIGTWPDIKTSGSYPNYNYSREGFYIRAHFTSSTAFTGYVEGVLSTSQDGPDANGIDIMVGGATVEFTRK